MIRCCRLNIRRPKLTWNCFSWLHYFWIVSICSVLKSLNSLQSNSFDLWTTLEIFWLNRESTNNLLIGVFFLNNDANFGTQKNDACCFFLGSRTLLKESWPTNTEAFQEINLESTLENILRRRCGQKCLLRKRFVKSNICVFKKRLKIFEYLVNFFITSFQLESSTIDYGASRKMHAREQKQVLLQIKWMHLCERFWWRKLRP